MAKQPRPESLASQEVTATPKLHHDPRALAFAVAEAAWSRNAYATKILDISKVASFSDYFVIFSGRSERHVLAIAEAIQETMKQKGVRPLGVEGRRAGTWVLLDYGNVIVHVFERRTRDFYNLEALWSDAETVEVTEPQWVQDFARMVEQETD